jgi:hypothetical protein
LASARKTNKPVKDSTQEVQNLKLLKTKQEEENGK